MDYLRLDLLSQEHFTNLTSHSNLTDDVISFDSNELNWPILTLSILAISGTLGNLLVCVSISLDKQLQTVTNWFLFSLAIADCLVSLIVLPLAIIKDFQGESHRINWLTEGADLIRILLITSNRSDRLSLEIDLPFSQVWIWIINFLVTIVQ